MRRLAVQAPVVDVVKTLGLVQHLSYFLECCTMHAPSLPCLWMH